jgi:hypothetical protein
MGFTYRRDVLNELERHGLKPSRESPPDFIREYINDLYLYEIRALRRKMRAGLIARADYAGRVDELRRRYPLLSLPLQYWTEPE